MTTEELLRELETQTHAGRVRAMIDLGRRGDSESGAIIAQLAERGFYERSLALYSCFGSRDAAHVLRSLNDPSRLLRGLAARLVATICDDTQTLTALTASPVEARVALLWKLRTQRRQSVIDAYLGRTNLGDKETVAKVAPFGSAETMGHLAPRFAEGATLDDWRKLVRLHPELALSLLESQMATATAWDGRLLARVNTMLPTLAGVAPDRSLALVASLRRIAPLSSFSTGSLAERRPAAFADLVLSEDRAAPRLSLNLRKGIRKLSVEQIQALRQRYSNVFGWGDDWFTELPPSLRLPVFLACERQLRNNGVVSVEIVGVLPREAREREAHRHLSNQRLTMPYRLRYAAYLPWEEVEPALTTYLHSSDATTRQTALSAQIEAVAYARNRAGEVLAQLQERRTEQDGTRRVIFEALGELPASVWRDDHLPEIAELIRHGLNDVGLSLGTTQQILALLLKMLPAYPEWAASQIATIFRERGWNAQGTSDAALGLAAETALANALLPLLGAWAERDDEAAVVSAINAFLVRPETFVLAAEVLEGLLRRTTTRERAQQALMLFAERAHERFVALVPLLIKDDPTWITFEEISSFLLRRRQDLLDPFLAYRAYDGRWGTGRRKVLLSLSTPFGGGTARQQMSLAEAAFGIVADDAEESVSTSRAIKLLTLLPALPAGRVATLAEDPRSTVRTTALFALARLDTDGGLPTLVAALQDARARIAIHAIHRYAVAMPPAEALALLRNVPIDRVTVAKEVVRLIGELSPDEAYAELLALNTRDLHRDVRIALLRTFADYLDRDQTWVILEAATRSPEQEIALAPLSLSALTSYTLATQQDRATQARALRLAASLVEHPERAVRMEALRYAARVGVPDDERILSSKFAARAQVATGDATAREEMDERVAVVAAFFGVCTSEDGDATIQMLREVLPTRQLVQKATDALASAPRLRERRLLPVVRAALTVLMDDPLTAKLSLALAIPNLPADALAPFLIDLGQRGALHADALVYAEEHMARLNRFEGTELLGVEESLATQTDERLRRLAFAVLQARARKQGDWDQEMLTRLSTYRGDASPLVASAAQFTFPPEEEGDGGDDGDFDDDDDYVDE